MTSDSRVEVVVAALLEAMQKHPPLTFETEKGQALLPNREMAQAAIEANDAWCLSHSKMLGKCASRSIGQTAMCFAEGSMTADLQEHCQQIIARNIIKACSAIDPSPEEPEQ